VDGVSTYSSRHVGVGVRVVVVRADWVDGVDGAGCKRGSVGAWGII
jgi:hypothetical protein